MQTLIVGDVHGCSVELESLIGLVRADRVVLVGDLYTKGPDPAGVWRQMRDGGFEAVLGNHDARLLDAIAGRRPKDKEAHRCIARLDAQDRSWRDHLAALPLFLPEVGGYTVVHAGLHPSGDLSRTSRAMAIAMRRFPEGKAQAPLWHEVYTADRPVVFGHDARRGLVCRVRAGRPLVVGLDSGCVYGGVLSGLLAESGELVQVPARAVYQKVD